MHKVLIMQLIEILKCAHQIILNHLPTLFKENTNITIWARGLVPSNFLYNS